MTGDFEAVQGFHAALLSVPHSEIKAQLDAEKAAKRTPKSASRVSAVPSKPLRTRRFSHLAGQFCIGQSLPCDLRYCQRETIRIIQRIVFGCAVVIPEYLLIHIAVKMERFDANVCSVQSPASAGSRSSRFPECEPVRARTRGVIHSLVHEVCISACVSALTHRYRWWLLALCTC